MTADQSSRDGLLVNAKRAAELLSISPRKLWEMTNCRAIPHVRVGRSLRYPVADLEAWIEARTIHGD